MNSDFFRVLFKDFEDFVDDMERFYNALDLMELHVSHEFFQKYQESIRIILESSTEMEFDEAVFLWSKSYIKNKSSASIESKHKKVSRNKDTSEDFENGSQNNETKCGVNYSFKSKNYDFEC